MSRRRIFSSVTDSSHSGSRQRSWADCYAVPRGTLSSSEPASSGRQSLDHTPAPVDSSSPSSPHCSSPHRSSTSSLYPQVSPPHSTPHPRSPSPPFSHNPHSPSFPAPSPPTSERSVLRSQSQSNSWSRPSTTSSRIQPVLRSSPRGCNSSRTVPEYLWAQPRSRQRSVQIFSRRTHHGRRLGQHLPVSIPPTRWYTGVGSRVCAQCRIRRSFQRTSWMCLECRVPLCLLAWRNCYSQWHSGE